MTPGKTPDALRAATVIIPAYNAEPWVNDSVRSALDLPFVTKVVLIDDGSARPQADALHADLRDDPRLHSIQKPNAGVSAARNTGIEHVDTPWMITLDADDVLLPGVADAIDLARKLNAAVVVSAREEIQPSGQIGPKDPPPHLPAKRIIPPESVHHAHAIWGASGQVISARVLNAGVRYDTDLSIGEDIDFVRKAAPHGGLAISPTSALRVRLHDADASNLTGSAHLARRVDDFILLAERWGTSTLPPTREAWRSSWLWLAKRVARAAPGSPEAKRITAFGKSRGWRLPVRVRLAAWLKGR